MLPMRPGIKPRPLVWMALFLTTRPTQTSLNEIDPLTLSIHNTYFGPSVISRRGGPRSCQQPEKWTIKWSHRYAYAALEVKYFQNTDVLRNMGAGYLSFYEYETQCLGLPGCIFHEFI